jgi:hypothetical protein
LFQIFYYVWIMDESANIKEVIVKLNPRMKIVLGIFFM